jgi:DNA-binding phage protein
MSKQVLTNRQADRPHDDAMAETFSKDPALAAEMLTAILADGDREELLVALRQIARAKGSMAAERRAEIAEKAAVRRSGKKQA